MVADLGIADGLDIMGKPTDVRAYVDHLRQQHEKLRTPELNADGHNAAAVEAEWSWAGFRRAGCRPYIRNTARNATHHSVA